MKNVRCARDDVVVEPWDKDAGPPSEDDLLGKVTIIAGLAGTGELKHEFKLRKARYTLRYEIE